MRTQIMSTLLGLASIVYGSDYTTQTEGGVKYSVSVPANTASSGSGDIYIQISGPSSNSWIGLGQGSQMSGAKMFIIYASSSGNNITLSPRTASGHNMPTYDSSAQVTLMAGSGISNGNMVANIKCSDCLSKVKVSDSSSKWIYAVKSGSALNTDSTSASISQHSNYGPFTIDMTAAKSSANTSPFTSSASTSTGSSTGSSGTNCDVGQSSGSGTSSGSSGGTATTSSGGGFFGGFGGSSPTSWPPWATGSSKARRAASSSSSSNACTPSNGNSASALSVLSPEKQKAMLQAHGILAGLAFAILFPFGAISMRLMSFPGLVWFHAAFQAFAYLTYIVGFGLGVYLATQMRLIDQYHPVIGIVLFVLIFFQPIFGILHHSNFKKFQTRTGFSHAHIWLGRIVITLGIINGGLGFKLADNTSYGPIVYGVIAGLVWCIYVAAIIIGERRRARNRDAGPPKYEDAMSSAHNSPPGHSPVGGAAGTREFYARRK